MKRSHLAGAMLAAIFNLLPPAQAAGMPSAELQQDGSAPRPFTVYVVGEAGRAVVANIVPDRLVEARHR